MSILSHANIGIGILLFLYAIFNYWYAKLKYNEAENLSEKYETDRVCKQTNLLEMRILMQTYEIIAVIGIALVFIK